MAANDTPGRAPLELRSAIERELQERLRARSTQRAGLQCLTCHQLNPVDARFCTACGTRFNAVVVDSDSDRATSEG